MRVLAEAEAGLLHRSMLKVSGFRTVARLLDQPFPPVEIPTLLRIRHSFVVGCAHFARAQVCKSARALNLCNRGKPIQHNDTAPIPPPHSLSRRERG